MQSLLHRLIKALSLLLSKTLSLLLSLHPAHYQVVLRQAGNNGRKCTATLPPGSRFEDVREMAISKLALGTGEGLSLVHNGKILDDKSMAAIKEGETIWAALDSQPPTAAKEETPARSPAAKGTGDLMAVDGGGDDPITQQIKELRNAVSHLVCRCHAFIPGNPRRSPRRIF